MNKIVIIIIIIIIIGVYTKFFSNPTTPSPTTLAPTTPVPTKPLTKAEMEKKADDILNAYYKSTPAPTNEKGKVITKAPTTTIYPLTDMAIKISFPLDNNFNRGSMSTFSEMLKKAIKNSSELSSTLKKMTDDGKTDNGSYDLSFLNCFVLYTDIFNKPYPESGDPFQYEYDVVASYFIFHLQEYLGQAFAPLFNNCYYFESIKRLNIPSDALTRVLQITSRSDSEDAFLFTGGMMPMPLDTFVRNVGRYVYSNFANSNGTAAMWENMKFSCGSPSTAVL
jgi:hypothetical protein